MRNDEHGTILVEFVGTFLMFVLLIVSILSLVNIVTLQARVHYALTETANTLSMYGYVLDVTGVAPHLKNLAGGHDTVTDEANATIDDINQVLNGINGFDRTQIEGGANSLNERFESWTGSISDDPKGAFQKLLQYGGGELSSLALGELLEPLMRYYLENGEMSGGEYLQSVRVIGELDYYDFTLPGYKPAGKGELVGTITKIEDNDSILLDADGNVKLTVTYYVDYSFFGLQLPFDPQLKITQSAMTKMWLGGSGDGYKR